MERRKILEEKGKKKTTIINCSCMFAFLDLQFQYVERKNDNVFSVASSDSLKTLEKLSVLCVLVASLSVDFGLLKHKTNILAFPVG